uniref:Uncharacterized protein n=1 Tax=Acrobeloides nanus TaxID=290746 RepID=A0A914E448_9BILA
MYFLKPAIRFKPNFRGNASASSWLTNYRREKPKKNKEPPDPYTPGVTPELYKNFEDERAGLIEFEHMENKEKIHPIPSAMLSAYKHHKEPKNRWPIYHYHNKQ